MDTKIQDKIERFIKLSITFSKKEDEIFDHKKISSYSDGQICLDLATLQGWSSGSTITMGSSIDGIEIYIDDHGYIKAKDDRPLSRAEEIRAKAEIQAKLSDDYDEYISLQKDLREYFKISNKLTQD